MKHIRYWLSSKRRQMAKLHDLQRQLQEAWDKVAILRDVNETVAMEREYIRDQLHRVARERDKERELRLAAEDRLLGRYTVGDKTLAEAASELRDVYLEELANEEE